MPQPPGVVVVFKPVKYHFKLKIEFLEMGTAVLNMKSVSVLKSLLSAYIKTERDVRA